MPQAAVIPAYMVSAGRQLLAVPVMFTPTVACGGIVGKVKVSVWRLPIKPVATVTPRMLSGVKLS